MHSTHLRPLSFGEILDSAFSLYRRHFVPLFITTLIPLVPSSLVMGVFSQDMARAAADNSGFTPALIPVFLLSIVASIVMWAALAREVGQGWTGGEVAVGDGYRHGLRAFFPLVGAGIVAYLLMLVAVFGIGIAAALVGGIVGGVTGGGAAAAVVMVPLMIVVAIAMMIAASTLFAVLPAVVIEKLGPFRAIGRSVSLSRGALLRVVGIMIVSSLIVALPLLAALMLTGGFSAFTNPGEVPRLQDLWLQQLANSVVGALTTPFLVASLVILYFDRRVRTEALDVQMAADALAVG